MDIIQKEMRTVVCRQLSVRMTKKDLEKFFEEDCGKVRAISMIGDRIKGRSKGIAYVEFYEIDTVAKAMLKTGQKLMGIPIIVEATQSERNRIAQQAIAAQAAQPTRLYVGNLPSVIGEEDLRIVFEALGPIESVSVHKDDVGRKSYAFIQYKNPDTSAKAEATLNGYELLGKPMKVTRVKGGDAAAMESLDDELGQGVGLSSLQRVELMAKLMDKPVASSAPMTVTNPNLAPLGARVGVLAARGINPEVNPPSQCVILTNMFDPTEETQPNWHLDIQDDVLDECSQKFGDVVHIYVDKNSLGHVYLKFRTVEAATKARNDLNGRFFDKKRVSAEFITLDRYHQQFPGAATATMTLRPS
eukprot:Colp12_sorted_trinity150504_noHs@19022